MPIPAQKNSFSGLWAAVFVYSVWGFFPLYFTLLTQVPALNVLAFRIVFAFIILMPIALARGKQELFGRSTGVIGEKKSHIRPAMSLLFSSILITGNWLIFIMLVQRHNVLESSLGYFINPLISVLFGVVFLRERLRPLTWLCVLIAAGSMSFYTYHIGALPWGAMGVALTFAGYALLRKLNPTDSLTALTIEMLFMCPLALVFLLWQNVFVSAWEINPYLLLLLVGSGAITAFSFLIFGFAASRVQLSTLGMMQYMTPTFSFLCATCLLGETIQWFQWWTFIAIWLLLLLYVYDSLRPRNDCCHQSASEIAPNEFLPPTAK